MAIRTYDFTVINDSHGAANFTIECKDLQDGILKSRDVYIFKIHKAAVQGQSPYLDMLMTGGFQETEENHVKKHDDPAHIAAILWYLYHKDEDIKIIATGPNTLRNFIPITRRLANRPILNHIKLFETVHECLMPAIENKVKESIQTLFFDDSIRRARVQMLEEVFAYLFHDDPPSRDGVSNMDKPHMEELRELLVHLCQRLDDPEVELLCNQIPKLGFYMYKECAAHFKNTSWPCTGCGLLQDGKSLVTIFARTDKPNDNDITPIGCNCGFRGICSDNCKADESFFRGVKSVTNHNHGLFCITCVFSHELKFRSDFWISSNGLVYGRRFRARAFHCTEGHFHIQLLKNK